MVSLSKKKLQAAGRVPDLNSLDAEIVADAATVYLGGYAAEVQYCRIEARDALCQPDRSFANNDYEMLRQFAARVPSYHLDIPSLEAEASKAVETNWHSIERLAKMLLSTPDAGMDAVSVVELLDGWFGQNTWAS
jgi:hypothetical protein